MDPRFREFLAGELEAIREQGLFKEEWPILGQQGPEIRVEGRDRARAQLLREQLPRPVEPPRAARRPRTAALDEWGYGMSSVRFICGTQALHLELEKRDRRVPRDGGRDPLRRLLRRQRRRLRAAPRRRRRDRHRPAQPRLDHRRRAPVQGEALRLRARRHGGPRGEARGGRRPPLPADRHRRRLLDGRRRRAAAADLRPGRAAPRPGDGRRLATPPASWGKTGRGTPEHCGVGGRVDIITTTFGKALGGASGGCIAGAAGDRSTCCASAAGPTSSRTRSPPAVVGATLRALELLTATTELRDRLEANTQDVPRADDRGRASRSGPASTRSCRSCSRASPPTTRRSPSASRAPCSTRAST